MAAAGSILAARATGSAALITAKGCSQYGRSVSETTYRH